MARMLNRFQGNSKVYNYLPGWNLSDTYYLSVGMQWLQSLKHAVDLFLCPASILDITFCKIVVH